MLGLELIKSSIRVVNLCCVVGYLRSSITSVHFTLEVDWFGYGQRFVDSWYPSNIMDPDIECLDL